MWRAPAILAGCIALLMAAHAAPSRVLLQADADIIAEDQFAPVFQLVIHYFLGCLHVVIVGLAASHG